MTSHYNKHGNSGRFQLSIAGEHFAEFWDMVDTLRQQHREVSNFIIERSLKAFKEEEKAQTSIDHYNKERTVQSVLELLPNIWTDQISYKDFKALDPKERELARRRLMEVLQIVTNLVELDWRMRGRTWHE